jgi:hypothetical protein
MSTATSATTVLLCRYRYATGCAATFNSRQAQGAHEKSPVHARERVELRACPECEAPCRGEMERAMHLSNEHGIRAGSERRQELDARQVQQILAARQPGAEPDADVPAAEPDAAGPGAGRPLDGHLVPADPDAPPFDLSEARGAFAALVSEVEALRARNAALEARNTELEAEEATFATVRSLLAAQNGHNGIREHAATAS